LLENGAQVVDRGGVDGIYRLFFHANKLGKEIPLLVPVIGPDLYTEAFGVFFDEPDNVFEISVEFSFLDFLV
jgi:hypothetical protein